MMEEKNQEVVYDGFVTPCLILEGSDKEKRGNVIDPYAKIKEQDALICGEWSRGFEDGLIHVYLTKPVAIMCGERFEWVNRKILLKEPIPSMTPTNTERETLPRKITTPKPKQKVVFDPVTKQFHLEM